MERSRYMEFKANIYSELEYENTRFLYSTEVSQIGGMTGASWTLPQGSYPNLRLYTKQETIHAQGLGT